MGMTINTNLQSLNAQRNLSTSQTSLANSMQRLSSGLRLNSAKDDAAGLAISERMGAQVRGMNVAIRNANDGISLAQTAEGALGKIGENLQRMRELAVQAANDTNGSADRTSMDKEFKALAAENERVIKNTKFNNQELLTGSGGASGSFGFQIGANTAADNQISLTTTNMATELGSVVQGTASTATLGSTASSALAAVTALDTALDKVNGQRAEFGAVQNRFDAVIANLQVASENTSAARSRITDADFAQETANLSRSQILQQAGTAMVAQANQLPQGVLSLLR
ncbi:MULTISPECIES: flagellin N-terminal helical domain-containing protein [Comamonas]|uniref:flagellin N-terminal helical domain-containing protein n=1 Tax=Comamonas thiooxydans TaxID=363952 RepID=UPI002114EB6A|nr:flagellin [Comamonas thiooxydans]UUE93308.1 flagellin FliC [Comamonas thiooxydans]